MLCAHSLFSLPLTQYLFPVFLSSGIRIILRIKLTVFWIWMEYVYIYICSIQYTIEWDRKLQIIILFNWTTILRQLIHIFPCNFQRPISSVRMIVIKSAVVYIDNSNYAFKLVVFAHATHPESGRNRLACHILRQIQSPLSLLLPMAYCAMNINPSELWECVDGVRCNQILHSPIHHAKYIYNVSVLWPQLTLRIESDKYLVDKLLLHN